MIINGQGLLRAAPIQDMLSTKERKHGVSHGLSEVGYDLRVKQTIRWNPPDPMTFLTLSRIVPNSRNYIEYTEQINMAFFGFTEVSDGENTVMKVGRTAIASSVEKFSIPPHMWCEFRNKSTMARCFVDASIGTDGEPGWQGYLTIEIIFHDNEPVEILAGSGLLKAVFHEIREPAVYDGKYQDQPDRPVEAIFEGLSGLEIRS